MCKKPCTVQNYRQKEKKCIHDRPKESNYMWHSECLHTVFLLSWNSGFQFQSCRIKKSWTQTLLHSSEQILASNFISSRWYILNVKVISFVWIECAKALLEAVRLFGNYGAEALKRHRTANCLLSEKSMTGSLIVRVYWEMWGVTCFTTWRAPCEHPSALISARWTLALQARKIPHHFKSSALKYGAARVIALISISFISPQEEATWKEGH